MPRIRLIIRGDDAGSCDSANRAIVECCRHGVLRNVSVMVPGPAFEAAVPLLASLPNVCLGLHVTLNAEWDRVKWGPVLPTAEVPSLVDTQGDFLPAPSDLQTRQASVDEMLAEVEAQLAKARAHGLHLGYLDEHMGVGWLPGLGAGLAALCAREGLVYRASIPSLPNAESLAKAEPGTYVWVTHPGYDAPDMQVFGGLVSRERDADRRALQAPHLRETLRALDVESILYTDA